jgi:hypothetical protein
MNRNLAAVFLIGLFALPSVALGETTISKFQFRLAQRSIHCMRRAKKGG